MKLSKLLKNWRIIILICLLVIAVLILSPQPNAEGVIINSVLKGSAADLGGLTGPEPTDFPRDKEVIRFINNEQVKNIDDYQRIVADFSAGEEVQIQTSKGLYRITVLEETETIILDELENKTITETIIVNETINGSIVPVEQEVNRTILVNKTTTRSLGVQDIGLGVLPVPTTNLRKGLDLQGGTRVLLQPTEEVDDDTLELIRDSLRQRLNVYGLSDINIAIVQSAPDIVGGGQSFILVEIAGVTEDEVKTLIASQGKFEAKIANQTVFRGGQDITYVCRTATCSGIDPNVGCGQLSDGTYSCGFYFSIKLTQEAANAQAAVTQNLDVVTSETGYQSLSETLQLFLDDSQVDELNIAADLKGRAVTDIAISGGGAGLSEADAATDALTNMKQLQTILITGSLPVSLDIVRVDTISAQLGEEFVSNALLMGLLAIAVVIAVIVIAYRKISLAIPIALILVSEVVLILGMAAFIGWNIDLAAIAGIIVAIGTGVDDQIVIADETLKRRTQAQYRWKEKVKRAFFIIMTAYFTTIAAMVPLLFAGAGLLKGFALTTILGVTIGVLVTRPAFAAIVEYIASE